MNWVVFHVASGQAFFTGVALILAAAFAATRQHRLVHRLAVVSLLVGLVAVVISSTPLPFWLYALTGAATLTWAASRFKPAWRRWATPAVLAAWLLAAAVEVPYHLAWPPPAVAGRSVTVVGDSLSAGIGGEGERATWPHLLARDHGLDVRNLSHMGDTTAAALKRVRSAEIPDGLVIVEIGGNDLLGSTTAARFATDLDALLTHLAAPGRRVVMFELPLPPFGHEYGRAQRQAAARHGVTLIPKRVLMAVLSEGDATLDAVHLSPGGHGRLAGRVWEVVGPAIAD